MAHAGEDLDGGIGEGAEQLGVLGRGRLGEQDERGYRDPGEGGGEGGLRLVHPRRVEQAGPVRAHHGGVGVEAVEDGRAAGLGHEVGAEGGLELGEGRGEVVAEQAVPKRRQTLGEVAEVQRHGVDGDDRAGRVQGPDDEGHHAAEGVADQDRMRQAQGIGEGGDGHRRRQGVTALGRRVPVTRQVDGDAAEVTGQ